jgi:hypothetical protein
MSQKCEADTSYIFPLTQHEELHWRPNEELGERLKCSLHNSRRWIKEVEKKLEVHKQVIDKTTNNSSYRTNDVVIIQWSYQFGVWPY